MTNTIILLLDGLMFMGALALCAYSVSNVDELADPTQREDDLI